MDVKAGTWTARDGKRMPFQLWPGAPAKPRAALICVHGLSGAASDFWPVGESFPAAGYVVYGMELRGQGNDPDKSARGDIRSRRKWIQDLQDFSALVRSRHPGIPVFWYGESLGALITLHAAAGREGEAHVDGIILSSPVVELRENLRLGFFRNLAVRTLLSIAPGHRVSLEKLGNSEVQVTSQTTHRQQMEQTPHYVREFTLRLFGEVEKMIRGSGEAARRVRVPVLVMYTPHDALTSQESVERFCNAIVTGHVEKMFFPESYHLILHDTERETALRRLRVWLDRMAKAPPSRTRIAGAG